jgi:hypothetical protein
MPQKANVTSVDALRAFKSNLIVYLGKARPALEEAGMDVMRARLWLQNEQRSHWENQARIRARALEEAEQALFSSRLSNLREPTTSEIRAVNKAKRSLEEARGKLDVIKKWNRDFDTQVQPLLRQLEKLHTILANDMPKAAAYLTEAAKTLDAYGEVAPPAESENPTGKPVAEDLPGSETRNTQHEPRS